MHQNRRVAPRAVRIVTTGARTVMTVVVREAGATDARSVSYRSANRHPLRALVDQTTGRVDDAVDEAVALRLRRRHVLVAVEVTLDALERLAGVAREEAERRGAEMKNFLRQDFDVRRGSAAPHLRRLVHHDARVRQRSPPSRVAGREQEAPHA